MAWQAPASKLISPCPPPSLCPRRQLVLRQHCCKGCQGCLLRSIQRFGRLGKRSWSDAAPDSQASPSSNSMKVRWLAAALARLCMHG